MHTDCTSFLYRDKCAAKTCVKATRNVIYAIVEVNITAHEKLCVEVCHICCESKTGDFPKDVKANVQYGKNLSALDTIRRKLSESPLAHWNETGTNIDGKLHWVHDVSNGSYTSYMTVSKKRGYEGIKSAGILPDYRGIIVQDCGSLTM